MITDIRLQNFRSYADESFEFDPGVNIIVGPNASGKTNLLEAIMVSCLGNSYRARDTELIAFDQPWARLDAHNPSEARTLKLVRQETERVQKELIINQQTIKRITLLKTIPTVLFEPNHLLLLSGPPELRREYIDNLLTQLVPGFDALRRQYRRALAQRNSLLKQGGSAYSQLFAWNIRLSQTGGQIARERLALLLRLNKTASELYGRLSNTPADVSVQYHSSCPSDQYESELLHKLEASTELDLKRGFTAYGPHRDDIQIFLGGHLMQETASRGETRTLLLVLKVLELILLEEQRGQKPILLLDDVFSELDGARRRALTEALQDHQTFITTTDADIVVQQFMGNCRVIPLQRSEK